MCRWVVGWEVQRANLRCGGGFGTGRELPECRFLLPAFRLTHAECDWAAGGSVRAERPRHKLVSVAGVQVVAALCSTATEVAHVLGF